MPENILTQKKCSNCKETKAVYEFNKHKCTKDGLQYACKACCNARLLDHSHTKDGLIAIIYRGQVSRSRRRKYNMPSYTKLEFKEWMRNQPNFDELYDAWQCSGYDKALVPSCDRLNDYKSYTIDNIQLITWRENNAKGNADQKAGINNKISKAVVQLSNNGDFIAEHHSGNHASRVTGASQGGISECCSGDRKTAGGFKWSLAK